ncbi:hypothetical protein HN51_046495 [Arachis hypogaea]|uniref:uncharacterized protein LOC107628147 n=1 Tax=Arachis ipaensis TaxID=130454 RepID=UPI0007AFC4A5|nr:uncharacterized protein LOC107628147 [Arachis ipaensis]XP_025635265.1 uncharacterized protein LOC112729122 [Arachis hypogaea]
MAKYNKERSIKVHDGDEKGKQGSKNNNNGGISRKCALLVKEQRARLYILRRCATMLLCWYIHGDD